MRARVIQLVWLTAVWLLLWGMADALTLLGGVLVAVLVTVAFPPPARSEHLPLRPLWLLRLAGHLAVDLVLSNLRLSWEIVRHGRRSTAGIVAVPLFVDAEMLVATIANGVSVVPGTLMLQIERRNRVCYVYQVGMRGPGDADRVRRDVLTLQRQVIAALGSAAELAAVDAELRALS